MNEIKMQKSTMQERDDLLRKEGFINGENAMIIPGEKWVKREEALSATVARLKEVAK